MKRTVEVDWDSFEEVSSLFQKTKARYFQLKRIAHPEEPSYKECQRQIMSACQKILDTDISKTYSDLPLSQDKIFYVYAHLNGNHKVAIGKSGFTTFAGILGCTHFPFYIGKGQGDRCFDLNRNGEYAKIAKRLKITGDQIIVHKIKEGLTESEALQLESKLIDIFGLRPYGGMLSNLDEGFRSQERRSMYREAFLKLRPLNKKL